MASTHLQHVLLAGFLLGGPAQRRPPQVHRELRDNLIGLVLSGEKKSSASTASVTLITLAVDAGTRDSLKGVVQQTGSSLRC